MKIASNVNIVITQIINSVDDNLNFIRIPSKVIFFFLRIILFEVYNARQTRNHSTL